MTYIPIERKDLEEMDQEDIIKNYNSLADWIQEKIRVNFERGPDMTKEQLIQTTLHFQDMYKSEIYRYGLADSLREWGEEHPGPVVYLL